ncbi:adenylate/guanylate cyclase domain-containing protein [Aestuariibacter halophilus]|uniref:Adenylate/guanylate cyclase domain-containing protein n=1 Tax=Fluctibacter halophilus TaxID=226011 RepID=A0ABS8GBG1_9ALTE|nr:adenylate/guanylate cyclase domain-containing protein [Aestuariibacter halophilus]MCC2617406.1 adenylate/guanylate cyclase domain-containing protein [Aestuariibacter halophilus]
MQEVLLHPFTLTLMALLMVTTTLAVWFGVREYHRRLRKLQSDTDLEGYIAMASESDLRFRHSADEAQRLTQTFQKFVPRQFVEHFAKHGSDTLELGHADEDDVAILFCDIRGFTGLSEKMTPQELMKFLNSYFLRMNDPIHQNGGFIDKFIGDAIMALFDHPDGTNADKARDALKAAVDLRYALNIYNRHRGNSGYPPINIGIGAHFGPVIIGTVGSDDRMDTTVIGDSVNIANRLESLAPKFSADIIVSAQLLDTANAGNDFSFRLLDWVRVKGRERPVEIYEILNHLPPDEQRARLASADLISKGLKARIARDWDTAIDYFEKAQIISLKDPLPAHHLAHCQRMRLQVLPKDWDGALDL